MSPRPPDQSDNDPTVPDPSDGTNPTGSAAERIIEKFGGIRPMAHKLGMPVTTVQGWKKRGAIPSARHPDLLAAAGRHNVSLDQAELDAAAPADERAAEDRTAEDRTADEATPAGIAAPESADTSAADTSPATPWSSARSYERPDATSTEPETETATRTMAEPIHRDPEPVRTPEPARASGGGKGLATFAILLALAGTGAAVTAPQWGPQVIPQIWPPRTDTDTGASQQISALEQRVQELASRGSDTAPLNDRIAQLEQRLSEVSQAQPQPQPPQQAEQAAPAGLDQAQVESIVQDRVQQFAGRIGALEQRSQPQPGVDRQALDARVAPLEQQLQALAQVRDRVQGLEGRVGTLDQQQGQAIARLRDSVAGLEQEANRLAQEINSTANRATQVAETLTLRQAQESKAQALVLAAGQLRASLQSSRPFTSELSAVRAVNLEDPQVVQALNAIEPHAADGIPTEAQLNQQFSDVAGEIVRAGVLASGASGEWWDKALSTASSLVSVRRTAGEIQGSGADAITARAERHLKSGRLDEAVKELETLTGEPATVAQPWIEDAKARLAANEAGALLTGQAIARLAGSAGGNQ
ncbi:mitofilin family membrane protein [Skermanella pratensis]|uniref:mitofilin family membrane protein n=1 Tax=Skermanella pratensis TaxID=2233999 RepID=UPI001300E0A6|nr:mitofilin family membrane protein [Skermanella pratensis]